MEKKLPICKLRSNSSMLSVWNNSNNKLETWETIQLERLYKDKEGKWKTSSTFRISDLDDLINILQEMKRQKHLKVLKSYPVKQIE